MYHLPDGYWEQIAKQAEIKHAESVKIFLEPEEATELLEQELKNPALKLSTAAQTAVMTILPSFLENKAIQQWMKTTSNQALSQALPEILTGDEAAELASRENLMLQTQIPQLKAFFQGDQPLTLWKRVANLL